MNCLVIGGSSGIGATFVEVYGQNYDELCVVGRREALSEPSSENISHYYSVDLSDTRQISEFIAVNEVSYDKLLFSAGVLTNNPLMIFDAEKYIRDVSVNLTATGLLIGGLSRSKKINRDASIVILSSINGSVRGSKGCIGYASAKAGLLGLVKVAANELGKRGIKVNCISPGMVETPLIDGLNHISEEQMSADKLRYPLNSRYATSREIAANIHYLLDHNTYITGQNIVVDGGHSIAG